MDLKTLQLLALNGSEFTISGETDFSSIQEKVFFFNQSIFQYWAASGTAELSVRTGGVGVTICQEACGRMSCIYWEDGPDYC